MSEKSSYTNDLLFVQFKKGNGKAFRKLFELYWEPMFIRAKSMVRNEDVAKDIIQDIWKDLWERRETLEIANFKSYTTRAVINASYNYFRANKFSTEHLEIARSINLSIGPETEQAHDLEQTEHIIEKSLTELTPRCQQIFRLSRVEGMPNEKIASILGISKGTVENQISHSLKLIRRNLDLIKFLLLFMLF